jgi:hypothetical protein
MQVQNYFKKWYNDGELKSAFSQMVFSDFFHDLHKKGNVSNGASETIGPQTL